MRSKGPCEIILKVFKTKKGELCIETCESECLEGTARELIFFMIRSVREGTIFKKRGDAYDAAF